VEDEREVHEVPSVIKSGINRGAHGENSNIFLKVGLFSWLFLWFRSANRTFESSRPAGNSL
jgi:hypothetical protein